MDAFYVPILKAKDAEFAALAHVPAARTNRTLPLLEVPKFPVKAKRFQNSEEPVTDYLNEVIENTVAAWPSKSIMVDPLLWAPDAAIEDGEHVMPYICSGLQARGLRVFPVIGYELWENLAYRRAIQSIDLPDGDFFCLRLDSHAIVDAYEPEHFQGNIQAILDDLGIQTSQCAILVDMGDIARQSYDELIDRASTVVEQFRGAGFRFVVTAGCSLPASINEAVKQKNSTGFVDRKEMLLWQALRLSYPDLPLAFGDYGVRNPSAKDDVIAPDANGKIRYTVGGQYFVVRGHSKRTGEKGSQSHELCRILIQSGHYMGPNFSWGDTEILACSSRDDRPGNGTTWIAIDTSHHLEWVVAELEEFEARVGVAAARAVAPAR